MSWHKNNPHLYHVLMSLRSLRKGNYFIVGPTSQTTFLDGAPWAVYHTHWLVDVGAIEELKDIGYLPYFVITPTGHSLYHILETWYKSLHIWQKLAFRFWGGHFPVWFKRLVTAYAILPGPVHMQGLKNEV